jgi:zinc/manganese transport system permease protein
VALALATVWMAVAVSYLTNLPVGFLVGSAGAFVYVAARLGNRLSEHRRRPPQR